MIPLNNKVSFPINTLLVNVLGALIIGVVVALFNKNSGWNERILLMLQIGFCGGFTALSALSLEALNFFESGNWGLGIFYIALTVVLCVMAVYFGQLIVR